MITRNFSDWLNQFNTKPIAYQNNPLVSENLNDMASVEPSNVENIPDKKDFIASVKRPNPRYGVQGEAVFAPKGHKKERTQSGVFFVAKFVR